MQDRNYENSNVYRSDPSESGREGRGLLDQIKRDVKSWFDSDDDVDHRGHQATRERNVDEDRYYDRGRANSGYGDYRMEQPYSSDYDDPAIRSRRHTGGYSRDNEYGSYRSRDRYNSGNYRYDGGERSERDYDRSNGGSSRAGYRPSGSNDDHARYGNDYYRRDDNEVSQYNSGGPYQYTYAEYWIAPGPFSGMGPKGYQRSADSLKEQVCERLEHDGRINAGEIEVNVENCEVSLSGKVPNRAQKRCAEQCAESVRGVRDVHNRLTIDSSLDTRDEGSSTSWRSAGSAGTTASSATSSVSSNGRGKAAGRSGTKSTGSNDS